MAADSDPSTGPHGADRPGGPAAGPGANPFASPQDAPTGETRPGRPSTDPSIEHEPHVLGYYVPADDGDYRADVRLAADADSLSEDDAVEHTVWDEPALSAGRAAAAPEGQLTYARWLDRRVADTTDRQARLTTLWVAAAAGPWGVLGALMTQLSGQAGGLSFSGAMAAIVLAPVTEEITKTAAALWVVEKRPFWFKSGGQVLVCAAAGGLVFAAIENVMYLTVYAAGGGASYAAWRWVVCTALHVVCSTIAGAGLLRVWREAIRGRTRPELALGMPCFAAAMVTHGLYNALATLAEAAGVLSFG
ncbi:MAG: PrsW family glutamic-type intramembrane protease [Planctomycetota bacterium]